MLHTHTHGNDCEALRTELEQIKRENLNLRNSNNFMHKMLTNLPVGLVGVSGERVLYANPALAQITDFSVAELKRKAFSDLFASSDDYQTWRENLIVPDNVNVLQTETRWQTAKGNHIYVQIYAYAKPDDQLQLFSVTDISSEKASRQSLRQANQSLIRQMREHKEQLEAELTERKLAEKELRAVNQTIETIIEASPAAIITLDKQGKVVNWNREAENIFGWKSHEVIGKTNPIIPPGDYPNFQKRYQQTLEGKTLNNQRGKRLSKSGLWVDVNISISRLKNAKGQIVGAMGMFIDISQKVKAQDSLRKLSVATEQSPISIIITSVEGKIEYVNPKFTRLTGYTPAEVLGENPKILNGESKPKEFYQELWNTILAGKEWRGEFYNRKKNGEYYYESATIAPIFGENQKITHFIALKEDITQRKTTEKRLETSQKTLKTVLNSIDAYIYVNDPETLEILFINKHIQEKFGNVVGKKCPDIFHPNTPESLCTHCKANELKNEGDFVEWEYQNKKSHTWFACTDSLIEWIDGRKVHIQVAIDITERKKAEEKTREWASFVTLNPAPAIRADRNGKLLMLNPATQQLIETQNSNNPSLKDLFPKIQTERLPQIISQESIEYFEQKIGNENFLFVIKGVPELNAVHIYGNNISERIKAEQALEESRNLLDEIINNSGNVLIFVKDLNGKYILVNKRYADTFGKEKSFFIGKNDFEIHPQAQARDITTDDKRIVQNAKPIVQEKTLTINQKEYSYFITKIPLYNAFGEMYALCGVATDITQLKSVEKELRELNATKDKFFSIIAHDLKNPFNTLLGFSELLTKNYQHYEKDKIGNFAKNIYNASKDGYALLENLLEWSRSQTGRIKFEPQTLVLNAAVLENMSLLENSARKKGVEIINNVQRNTKVVADRNMLHTVVRNLISNAIKFTPQGGKVEVSAQKHSASTQLITVSDTGIGISPENQKKLFRIEENFSTPGTEAEKGTGLGLILCQEFIHKHGGKIWVESEPGKGSQFKFTLPKPE